VATLSWIDMSQTIIYIKQINKFNQNIIMHTVIVGNHLLPHRATLKLWWYQYHVAQSGKHGMKWFSTKSIYFVAVHLL
jgi:hypothetical protein